MIGRAISPRTKGIACIIVSAFGFAVMAACVRLCDDFGGTISCFQKGFFRNFLAFLIALVVFVRSPRKGFVKLTGCLWLRSILGAIGLFANFYALSHITIAEGQTLNKTAPFFTVVFVWMFLGERLTWRQGLTLTLAFLGTILVAKPGFAGSEAFPLAMGLLGGVAAGSAYACLRKIALERIDAVFVVLFFSAFSCLVSVPFIVFDFAPMTIAQVLILVGAGVGAAIGQFGITTAYRFARPSEIAVFDYTNILFTAALGYLLFSQVPDSWSVVGMLLILLAAIALR